MSHSGCDKSFFGEERKRAGFSGTLSTGECRIGKEEKLAKDDKHRTEALRKRTRRDRMQV